MIAAVAARWLVTVVFAAAGLAAALPRRGPFSGPPRQAGGCQSAARLASAGRPLLTADATGA